MAYERTEDRIDKIKTTFLQMQNTIKDLEKSLHKYKSMYGTFEAREAARERVLRQLEDKYVPEMAIQSTEVHLDTTS